MPEVHQEKAQAGIESSRGTGVTATRILNGVMSPWNYNRELVWSEVHNGSYVGRQKASYSRAAPTTTYVEAASYEDLPWLAQLFAEGGVTGTGDSGSPDEAFEYAFDPDLTTDTLKSITVEHGVAGHVEDFVQVMVDTVQIRIAPDNTSEPSWMVDLGLNALGMPTSGSFASLSIRQVEEIRAAGTQLFIDDDAGDIGDTQKLGALIDASISIAINRHTKAFAENVTGAAPGKTGRGMRTIDAQFTFEFDNYDEYNDYLSDVPVLRAVRLYQEGSTIHTTVKKSVTLDIVGYWSGVSYSDREGNRTIVMTLQGGLIDAVFANDFKLTVVNGLSTLP